MIRENRYTLLKLRGLIAGLLLLLFAAYYINITLFTHYHVVDCVTIVHSHIHSEEHGGEESPSDETTNHLTLVQVLSNYIAELQSTPIYVAAILLTLQWSYRKIVERAIPTNSYSHPQLRAPPARILIG